MRTTSALSKCELTDVAETRAAFAAALGREPLAISSATGAGLKELVNAVFRELDGQQR